MTKKWLLSVFALAVVAAVALQITPMPAMAQDNNNAKTLTVDVAIDGSTLALNNTIRQTRLTPSEEQHLR